jgi:hypothetical protein
MVPGKDGHHGQPEEIFFALPFDAFGTNRTSNYRSAMSAFGGKADVDQRDADVR